MAAAGTIVRIGYAPSHPLKKYIILAHADWVSVQPGKDYHLSIQFDRFPAWDLRVRGARMGRAPSLSADFEDAQFFEELQASAVMKFDYNGKLNETLSLDGSTAAIAEMNQCQRKQLAGKSKDPFAE